MKTLANWHEAAIELRNQGWSVDAIGDEFGVTGAGVHKVVKDAYCPVNYIAVAAANRRKDTWSTEKDEYLTSFYKRGRSASQIADHLGVSRNAVVGRAYRLGLHK